MLEFKIFIRINNMNIPQLPKKTPEFDEKYHIDILELTIGDTIPKMKGSYTRKDMGDYITDIDNDLFVTFSNNTHTDIYNTLNKLKNTKNSKFLFVYLGCGWRKEFIPPWEIDPNGGCIFDLEKSINWVKMLEDKKLLPKTEIEKINSILVDSKEMLIKNLITIRSIVKNYGEIKWTIDDIEKGYIDYRKNRYYLVELFKKYNAILEFIYKPADLSYISLTINIIDEQFPIDQFKSFWPFYTKNYYAIFKSLRWKIYKDKQKDIFHKTMVIVSPYVSLVYQIINLKNLLEFNSYLKEDIQKIWFNIIEPSMIGIGMKKYNGKKFPSIQVLNNIEDIINKNIEKKILNNYPERLFLTFIKNPVQRKRTEIQLLRMKQAQQQVSKDELIYRWNKGNKCPFFNLTIDDINILADFGQRTYINLEELTQCFIDISIINEKSVKELIDEVYRQNHLSINIPKGKNEIKLFYKQKNISTHHISEKKKIQRFIITYKTAIK